MAYKKYCSRNSSLIIFKVRVYSGKVILIEIVNSVLHLIKVYEMKRKIIQQIENLLFIAENFP